MRKIWLILLFILYAAISYSKTIDIYYSEYEPFLYKDHKDQLKGFDYDILIGFCKEHDFNCNFIKTDFKNLLFCVKNNTCDIAAGAIYETEGRKKFGNFSIPYLKTGLVAVIPYDFNKDLRFLYKSTVGVKRNSTGHKLAKKLQKKYPKLKVLVFDSTIDSFKALEYGYVDWILNDYYNSLSLIYTKFRGDLKIVSLNKNPLFFQESSIAFFLPKQKKDLKILLDTYLIKKKASGEIQALINKWFYITKPINLKDYILYLTLFTVLVVSIIFLFIIFFIMLRNNKKLKNFNSLLEAMLDIPSVMIFSIDKDRKITFWNKGAELITGFGQKDAFQSIDIDEINKILSKCNANKKPIEDIIINLKTKKGNKVMLFDIYPIFHEENQCLFFGLDLTDTIKTLNSKLLYESLYHSVVENSPNGILMVSAKNVFINKTLQNWLNITEKVVNFEDLEVSLKTLLTDFIKSGQENKILIENQKIIKDKIVDIYLKRINLPGRQYYMGIFIDNTEKVRQQKIINDIQRDEILSNIVNSVVHDINNILSIISNYATILEMDEELSEKQKNIIRKIISVTQKSSSFLTSLLNISRISSENKLIFIDNFLEQKKEFFSQLLGPSIQLELILEGEGIALQLNEERFTQVLLNLILNAKDAIDGDGKITIKKYIDKDCLVIEVSDTGKGIPPEIQEKIFELFYTTKGEKGTGLGLYTVKIFMEEIGGKVKVISKEGEGTTFRLIFPLKQRV